MTAPEATALLCAAASVLTALGGIISAWRNSHR